MNIDFRLRAVPSILAIFTLSCAEAPPLAPLPEADEPEAVVAGTVRLPGNVAAEGVAVSLESMIDGIPEAAWALAHAQGSAEREAQGSPEGGPRAIGDIRVVTTDANGRFVFDAVEPGDYLVRSTANDHRAGSAAAQVLPPAESDAETTFVDIALVPVGKIYGVATLSGQAGSHASTIVYVGGSSNVAVTDDAGAWLLDDVPVGAHTVRAAHPGWHDATTTATVTAAGDSVPASAMALLPRMNIPPTASASAAAYGSSLLPFALGGAGADDDGSIALYAWDFEDDGILDWTSTTSPATTHLYPTAGAKRARLRVVDDDGDAAHAVVNFWIHDALYVATTGSDTNIGSAAAPFLTVAHAVAQAAALGNLPVRVALGSYAETLNFVNAANITGGYNAAWTRSPGSRSTILGADHHTATGLTSLLVTGLRFERAIPITGSAIAVRVKDCGSGVVFDDCAFAAGNAQDGLPGADGGLVGGGFGGGAGGDRGDCGGPSQNGSPGSGPNGGTGGPRGIGSAGGDGGNGGSGSDGNHGAVAQPGGFLFGGLVWIPNSGSPGTAATNGSGGGGGGGGDWFGNCSTPGGFGGTGGAGGNAGLGGGAATGGFASFALLCYDVAGSTPQFTNCIFISGAAGDGGGGGTGGAGQFGATGQNGTAPPFAHAGGDGGTGGAGGWGGGGSGGPGGWSYCVYAKGLAPTFTGCSFTIGTAGTGGLGGSGRFLYLTRAPDGPAGTAGAVLVVP